MNNTSEIQNLSSGWFYANLANYNNNKPRNQSVVGSNPGTDDVVMIPNWGGIPGYNSLTGKGPQGCSGYRPLAKAYPDYTNTCSFTQRACGN